MAMLWWSRRAHARNVPSRGPHNLPQSWSSGRALNATWEALSPSGAIRHVTARMRWCTRQVHPSCATKKVSSAFLS